MQLDSRQVKILQEMGIPMSGFALRKRNSSTVGEERSIQQVMPKATGNASNNFAPQPSVSPSASNLQPAPSHAPRVTPKLAPKLSPKKEPQENPFALINSDKISALDWVPLREEATDCKSCTLSSNRSRVVWGSLVEINSSKTTAPKLLEQVHALDWLIIDLYPSALEDQTANPLASDAGQLLGNMLKALRRQDVSPNLISATSAPPLVHSIGLVNAVKCHTPGGRNPDDFETSQCRPYLQRQIELLKPKAILILGAQTYKAVFMASAPNSEPLNTPAPPLTQLRNEVLHLHGVPAFVTYHPDSLLLHPQDKAKAWQDLVRAHAYLVSQANSNTAPS